MDEFSPAEAALEGVRLPRERPAAVLWWWAGYVVATVIQFAVSLAPPFQTLQGLSPLIQAQWEAAQQNPGDAAITQRLVALLLQAAPAFLLFAGVTLLLQMVLSTAVLRAVLRPAERAFGALRLSMDEVRQLGLSLIVLAVGLTYLFAVTLAMSVVLGLLQTIVPTFVLSFIAFAVLVVAIAYPAVRLSLAPAMTLADGRISVRRAWTLTQGQFWSLFGAYLIAIATALALLAARWAILQMVVVIAGGPVSVAEPKTLLGLLAPTTLVVVLFNALVAALLGAIATAPMAAAFRQLTGRVGAPPPMRPVTGSPWAKP